MPTKLNKFTLSPTPKLSVGDIRYMVSVEGVSASILKVKIVGVRPEEFSIDRKKKIIYVKQYGCGYESFCKYPKISGYHPDEYELQHSPTTMPQARRKLKKMLEERLARANKRVAVAESLLEDEASRKLTSRTAYAVFKASSN